jgi:hypothetical protein
MTLKIRGIERVQSDRFPTAHKLSASPSHGGQLASCSDRREGDVIEREGLMILPRRSGELRPRLVRARVTHQVTEARGVENRAEQEPGIAAEQGNPHAIGLTSNGVK